MRLANAPVELFNVADIIITRESRQRSTIDKDIDTLAQQMAIAGQINPITVRMTPAGPELVAGERRLMAAKRNGWEQIRATRIEKLAPREAFLIELLENLARRSLSWQDEATAALRYHAMRVDEVPGWTIQGTANDIGLSQSQMAVWLKVAANLADPEIAGCQTLNAAFGLLRGRADRALAAAQSRAASLGAAMPNILPPLQGGTSAELTTELDKLIGASSLAELDAAAIAADPMALLQAGEAAAEALRAVQDVDERVGAPDSPVLTADFLEWAPAYAGPKFDVLHVDFPYGKGYAGSNTRRTGRAHIAPTYADDPDIFWTLLATLLEHQDRLAHQTAHCMFWFDMLYYQGVIDSFVKAGWTLVQPFPLIWAKPYQGVAADTRRRPRHCYETALLFSRGDRKLVRLDQDFFEGRTEEKLHINQKSERMLKQFLSMLVDEHTALLDPTCGSGSALKVAAQLKAKRVFGLELDKDNAEVARFVLARPTLESE